MIKIPIVWWIVIVLTGVIVFQNSCRKGCPAVPSVVKIDTVIVHDITKIQVYTPVPVSVTKTEYLPAWIDTAAVVQDYLSKRAYQDTVRNKYGYVLVIDTISENKIANRAVTFHLDIPQITLTKTIQPKNQVYIGVGLGGSKDFVSFGPQLILKTNTDKMYWLGASYTTQNQYFFQAGAAWKIHF